MRALKAFVIGMAILLSVGVVVVVVAIVQRAGDVGAPAPVSAPASVGSSSDFGATRLALPAGAEIVDMVAEGERLILRLKLAGGAEQLIVLDLGSGRALGTVELERAP